jgi:membrane-associated phospholipid phosphatase
MTAREPAPALLPGPVRRLAAVLTAGCALIVAVGAVASAGKSRGTGPDQAVDSWLRAHLAAHHAVLQAISTYGVLAADLVAVVIFVAALALGRRNAAALTLVSVILGWALTEYLLKPLVNERINGSLTYPSGHTEAVACLAAIMAVLLLGPSAMRPRRGLGVLIVAVAAVAVVAVAVSMISLDYHYFIDTVAGAAIGIGVVLGTALTLDRPGVRRRLQPDAPAAPAARLAAAAPDAEPVGTGDKPSA